MVEAGTCGQVGGEVRLSGLGNLQEGRGWPGALARTRSKWGSEGGAGE